MRITTRLRHRIALWLLAAVPALVATPAPAQTTLPPMQSVTVHGQTIRFIEMGWTALRGIDVPRCGS